MKKKETPSQAVPNKGSLYLVATPIGNLEEMSPRAIRILNEVSCIACEDTRTSGVLLKHFGIATPTRSYHNFNEEDSSKVLMLFLFSPVILLITFISSAKLSVSAVSHASSLP